MITTKITIKIIIFKVKSNTNEIIIKTKLRTETSIKAIGINLIHTINTKETRRDKHQDQPKISPIKMKLIIDSLLMLFYY